MELTKILVGPAREAQIKAYKELEKKLGGKGASDKAAALIMENA